MKSFFLYTLLLVTFTSNALHASQISQLTFAAWNKPDVKLLFVMPKIIDKNTEVLFIIHGASRRNAKDVYFSHGFHSSVIKILL